MTDLASIKNIFSSTTPKLVFVTYRPSVTDTAELREQLVSLRSRVQLLAQNNGNIEMHEWALPLAPKDGSPSTSPSANIFQQLLGIQNVYTAAPSVVPALLAVNKGELCDVLKGLEAIIENSTDFVVKFAEHLRRLSSGPSTGLKTNVGVFAVSPSNPSAATIDVSKMVTMGQDLMKKGQAVYAEKFFAKALGVLDTVNTQIDSTTGSDENMEGSVAMVLAWLALSQLVQDRSKQTETTSTSYSQPSENQAVDRLEKNYAAWITPKSDVSRAVTLRQLIRCLPSHCQWDGVKCSAKEILAELNEIDRKSVV